MVLNLILREILRVSDLWLDSRRSSHVFPGGIDVTFLLTVSLLFFFDDMQPDVIVRVVRLIEKIPIDSRDCFRRLDSYCTVPSQ